MNYGFNYARKGAKIIVTTLSVTIIAALIFTFAALVPFINVNIKVQLSEDMFVAEGAGYKCSIAVPDIEEVQLLDELPKDSFTRSNGGSTNEYDIGYYKGRTYGKCMLFIWDGYSPVLMLKSHDKTVFVNSKQDGDIQALYDEISSKNN